jgi:hypothetical protein
VGVALLVVPWLVAGALYALAKLEASPAADASRDAVSGASSTASNLEGPWGKLHLTPIVISPPLEYVPSNWGPIEKPQWRFPETSRQTLERFFRARGLPDAAVNQLLAATRDEPRINGLVVTPDVDLVRRLDTNQRAGIYKQLALTALNERQNSAYRHLAASAEEWLGRSPISAATMNLVKPYVYPDGEFVYFSDIDLVRMELKDPAELQRLAKGLLRESTYLVELQIPPETAGDPAKLDALVEYWGRGGRRTDVRPIIESLASKSGHGVDISHLLPAQARMHLYRYPQITLKDLDKPSFANCFWTALNFFRSEPDDRLLDAAYAREMLKRDYYLVHDQLQLGDVALFADSQGNYFHAAVYLASDFYYGKNGTSSLSPWTIVPMNRLRGYYPEYAHDWNVTHYRRKGM